MAAVTTAVIAGLGLAYGVHSGERGKRQQKKALTRQVQEQQAAEQRTAAQQRSNEMQARAANRSAPDPGTLLAGPEADGVGSTLLTGKQKPKDKLGASSLLGE